MSDRFEIKVATQFSELEALSEEWHALWLNSPRREVFSTLAWARAWWRTFGDRWQVCSPLLYRSGRLQAILPLVRDDETIHFLGHDASDYNDILAGTIEISEIDALLTALDGLDSSWSRCTLLNVPEHSHLVRYWRRSHSSLAARQRMALCFHAACPSTVFRGADRERILGSIQKKKSLKRHRNMLRRLGEVQFEHLTDRAAIRRILPAFFEQYKQRRAIEGDSDEFFDSQRQQFYALLVDELDPAGVLRFGHLSVGDKSAAFHFGFEVDDRLIWYKPTFDVGLWSVSPGESLLSELFRYADSAGLGELDFTVGGEGFKGRFSTESRTNYRIEFHPQGAIGRLRTYALRTREAIKSSPKAGPLAASLASSVKRFSRRLQHGLERNGPLLLFRKAVIHAVGKFVYHREELLLFSISSESHLLEALELALPLEARFVGLEALAAASPDERAALSLDLISARKRLSRGVRCYAVYDGNALVHHSWIHTAEVITASETPGCRLELQDPCSVVSDCRTAESHQGRGIYTKVLRALIRHELEESRDVWIYCVKDNTASRRGIERAGFKHAASFRYRKVLGRASRGVDDKRTDNPLAQS